MPKKANIIIVGGTIASGKSTLVSRIATHFQWNTAQELNPDDELQKVILQLFYQGTRLSTAVTQFYFTMNRYKIYQKFANLKATTILDRGLWEDFFFAKLSFKNFDQKRLASYNKFLETTTEKLILNFGLPKAYIFLKVDWKKFKERIYARGRKVEISTFSQNEDYFRGLLNEYNTNFAKLLVKNGINVIEINTINKNSDDVFNYVKNILEKI